MAPALTLRAGKCPVQVGIAVRDPVVVAGIVSFRGEEDEQRLDARKLAGDRVFVPLQLVGVLATVNFVLNGDDESRLLATDDQVNIAPLAVNLNTPQIGPIQFDWANRRHRVLLPRLPKHVHEECLKKEIALPVAFAGCQQPREKVTVPDFDPRYAECVEDVEPPDLLLKCE